jgi:hypothetical protein
MHEIKEYIRKIVDDGSIEEMYKLSDMLDELAHTVKQFDEDLYKKYKMELYIMAYGDVLTESLAKEIVSDMRPYGEKFSVENAREIRDRYGMNNIDIWSFYTVVNMAYNDYRDIFGDNLEMYAMFTRDFIEDEDAKKGKVLKYFTM